MAAALSSATCSEPVGPKPPPPPPPPPSVATIQITPASDTLLSLGDTVRLFAAARDAQGGVVSGVTFTWGSSSAGVVTVSASGLATAIGNGSANVTASVATVSGTAQLHVAQDVATVQVSPPSASLLEPGRTQQFTAVARDAQGSVVPGAQFIWFSSNHNVAIVSPSGLATGTGSGAATVIAAARGVPGFATLTIEPVPSLTYTLTVSRTGGGTVTTSPGGIYCGVACASSFPSGTVVTLTATPDADAGFTGWSGACSGTGPCTITMDASKSVTATFAIFNLTVTSTGPGRVTSNPAGIDCGSDCQQSFPAGSLISLSATPDPGFAFSGWSGACSGTGPCAVAMNANQTVSATFGPLLTVTRAGDGAGTVTSNPAGVSCGSSCVAGFSLGATVTLTAAPALGSVFGGWQGACTGTGGCTVTLTAARFVTATFSLSTGVTLTITKPGTGSGTVTSVPAGIDCGADCSESYPAQTVVSLTATPAAGSLLGGFSGCVGVPCAVTMNISRTVTVTFSLATSVTVTKSGTGIGTVTATGIDCGTDCQETRGQGSSYTLTATAATGSVFSRWTSGPCVNSTSRFCTFTVGATAVISDAEFTALVPHTVSVVLAGAGSGSVASSPSGITCGVDCAEDFLQGSTVVLTATPAAGSQFDRWTTGACVTSTVPTCSFTVGASAVTITATFAPSATLTVTATNGRVTATGIDCGSDCTETYPIGRSITLNAAPSPGYSFMGWSGACSGTVACVLTMDASKSVTATFLLSVPLQVSVRKGAFVFVSLPVGTTCFDECIFYYAPGTTVTLTPASHDSLVTFNRWTGACTGTGSCTVTMDGSRGVTAIFNVRLTFDVLGTGVGSVDSEDCPYDPRDPRATCDIEFGHVQRIDANAANGSRIDSWAGCDVSTITANRDEGTCTVTMTGPRTIAVTFTEVSRLTVSKPGLGSGTVASHPAGIACGSDCIEDYATGTVVTLNAVADPASGFTGWGSAGSACTGTGPCTVTMSSSRTISANFGLLVPVTVTKAGIGTGRVTSAPPGIDCGADCSGTYPTGSSVTLTATADAGWVFAGWSGACTGTATCVIAVAGATSVTATFSAGSTLSVSVGGTGEGGVTSSPAGINCNTISATDCAETYLSGTVVNLTAGAFTSHSFTGWSGACTGIVNPCVVTMSAARSVTATFTAPSYALTVTKAGLGAGTVTSVPAGINCGTDCTETYTLATSVTLTAAPATGATFGGWSGGVCSGTALTCTVSMTAARAVTATFN